MPELPETETIARDLDALIGGAVIIDVSIVRADVLRELPADRWAPTLRGRRVLRVWRRAKLVVLDLAGIGSPDTGAPEDREATGPSLHVVVQPRFTGALLVDDGTLPPALRQHRCLSFRLADGRTLHYRDVRRLGTVACQSPARFADAERALGPEPLAPATTPALLAATLGRSGRGLKATLMDQRRLAGVGNIYATEACWRAALDPSRPCDTLSPGEWTRLHEALVGVLTASVAARGTSFRDYRDALGARGGFVAQLQAYGRAGHPCPRCGRRLVGTAAVDGRMTVFCAWCQR